MNAIEQIIAQVEELDAKATKGPFATSDVHSEYLHDIVLDYEVPDAGSPIVVATVFHDDLDDDVISKQQATCNAAMFATYRTAAPRLARALKKAVDALEDYAEDRISDDSRERATRALATITAELTK